MLKAGDILCHTHTLLLRTQTCAHVCSNRFCGLLPALFVACFMVTSVAWSIQRPVTVWLMNKRVFTRATSVPATHTHRQVAGQNTRSSDVTGPSWIPMMYLVTSRTLLVFIFGTTVARVNALIRLLQQWPNRKKCYSPWLEQPLAGPRSCYRYTPNWLVW